MPAQPLSPQVSRRLVLADAAAEPVTSVHGALGAHPAPVKPSDHSRRRPSGSRWSRATSNRRRPKARCSCSTHCGTRPEGERGRSSGPTGPPLSDIPAPASTHLWAHPARAKRGPASPERAEQPSTQRRGADGADVRVLARISRSTTRHLSVRGREICRKPNRTSRTKQHNRHF